MCLPRFIPAAWLALCVWLALMLALPAADVTIVGRQNGDVVYGDGEFRIPITNAGTQSVSSVQLLNATTGVWGSTTATQSFLSSGVSTPSGAPLTYGDLYVLGSGTIAPGATKYITVYTRFAGYNLYSYTASINSSVTMRVTYSGGVVRSVTLPLICSLAGTFSSSATASMTPNPFTFPGWTVSQTTPPSTVTLSGWNGAAGPATLSIQGLAPITVSLSPTSSTVVNIPNSDDVAEGAGMEVTSGTQHLGGGIIHKDTDGSFHSTITVTKPPAGGRVRAFVTEGKDYDKALTLWIPLASGAPAKVGDFALTRAQPIEWTTDVAGAYADSGPVELRSSDGGQIIARQSMVKAPDGSFDLLFTVSSDTEPDPLSESIARWELNLVNYRPEQLTVQLQVFSDVGTWVTVRSQFVSGAPSGQWRLVVHEMDNQHGQFSGRQYRWMSGETVLAHGTTPQPALAPIEGVPTQYGFVVRNDATIGYTEEEVADAEGEEAETDTDGDGVPDNMDFPAEPPTGTPSDPDGDGVADGRGESSSGMTRGEQHDDIATGVAKAMDRGGPGENAPVPGVPESGQGREKMMEFANNTAGLAGLLDYIGNLPFSGGGLQIPLTGQSLVMTIPTTPRPVTLNLTQWASLISQIRAILAAIVAWYGALYAMKILRNAFI